MAKIFIVLLGFVAIATAASLEKEPEKILSQEQEVNPDGSFHTKYETENGIAYQEDGSLKGSGDEAAVVSAGSFSYTAPDGTPIQLRFTADETGFHPVGDHLPVAPVGPEIPPAILRALEYIAAHPYVEPAENAGAQPVGKVVGKIAQKRSPYARPSRY